MKNIAKLLLVAGFVVILGSCGNEQSSENSSASKYTEQVDENTLRNAYFKLTARVPVDWVSIDHSVTQEMMKMGSDVAASGNADLKAVLEASEKNQYPLFSIFRYEPGSPVESNPNVMGIAESIRQAPGIKRGSDYFFHAKKLMAQANPNYEFAEGYSERVIGGVTFDQMDVTISLAGQSIKQSYYAAKYETFMVLIIESYSETDATRITATVLDGLTFDW